MSQAFRTVASVYSNATPVDFEVAAAGVSGDLAYLVGYERGWASVAGAPAEQISLRVTQLYRSEDGDWMLVHRHADPGPQGDPAVEHLRAAIRPPDGR